MPMSGWFARLLRSPTGSAPIEFALVLPFLLLLLTGLVEVGRAYYQAHAIERGLRASALFLARGEFPWTSEAETMAVNLVRTGDLGGATPLLASGWARDDAAVEITTTSFVAGEQAVPVIRVSATVPYDPLIPGLDRLLGLNAFTMRLYHEQPFIGQ
jgi:Flp pilus assembly protein TadG